MKLSHVTAFAFAVVLSASVVVAPAHAGILGDIVGGPGKNIGKVTGASAAGAAAAAGELQREQAARGDRVRGSQYAWLGKKECGLPEEDEQGVQHLLLRRAGGQVTGRLQRTPTSGRFDRPPSKRPRPYRRVFLLAETGRVSTRYAARDNDLIGVPTIVSAAFA